MKWLDGIIDSMDMSLSKLREMVKYRKAWHAACSPWGRRVRHDWATEQQSGCTAMHAGQMLEAGRSVGRPLL